MLPNNSTRGIKAVTVGLLLAVFATGALCAWWMVSKADREMRVALFRQAQQVAQELNIQQLQSLSGTEADLNSPVYPLLKEQLAAARSAMPQCRFVYLLGRKADQPIRFLGDSEPDGSKASFPPGQIYAGAPKAFQIGRAHV